MGKKRDSSVLVADAVTMDNIVKHERGGRMRIGYDGFFGPLEPGRNSMRESERATELRHRDWGIAAEMMNNGVRVVSEMSHRVNVDEYMDEAVEVILKKKVSEMITTSQGAMALLEKVRIDTDVGLAEVPLLYNPLFERINGPFPGGSVMIGSDITVDANVVFLEKMEAGEIVFGTITYTGAQTPVPIQTYAAGFEWTEDMIEYDRSYEIGMNARAFGRSYNYLLNHLHLSPIIAFSYAGGNTTAADVTGGATVQERVLRTFQTAYRASVQAVPQRLPSWILANEADRFLIEDALLTPVLDVNGNPLRRVPVEGIIYYNGATVTNGVKSYVYPGVTSGTCYFIQPRLKLKEIVHHDLRIDVGPEDISRLIEGQQVGRTRRTVYLDIANAVQKLTIPLS
jgi:hypothetical protein